MNKLFYAECLCGLMGALAFGVALFQHIQSFTTHPAYLLVDAGIVCLGLNLLRLYKERKFA